MRSIRLFVCLSVVMLCCAALDAQNQFVAGTVPTIYVNAGPGFTDALTAAIVKKKVPAEVVENKAAAEYVLESAKVDSKDESGAGKIARCMFLDCIGMNGFSEVSVRLVRQKDGAIVWAYQVRKANSGPAGIQSLSEAIAKHLKNDFLKKHGEW